MEQGYVLVDKMLISFSWLNFLFMGPNFAAWLHAS